MMQETANENAADIRSKADNYVERLTRQRHDSVQTESQELKS